MKIGVEMFHLPQEDPDYGFGGPFPGLKVRRQRVPRESGELEVFGRIDRIGQIGLIDHLPLVPESQPIQAGVAELGSEQVVAIHLPGAFGVGWRPCGAKAAPVSGA